MIFVVSDRSQSLTHPRDRSHWLITRRSWPSEEVSTRSNGGMHWECVVCKMQWHTYVQVSVLVRKKLTTIIISTKRDEAQAQVLGDIFETSVIEGWLALVTKVGDSFQVFTKTAIVPQGCEWAFVYQCTCLDTLATEDEGICIYMLSYMYVLCSHLWCW